MFLLYAQDCHTRLLKCFILLDHHNTTLKDERKVKNIKMCKSDRNQMCLQHYHISQCVMLVYNCRHGLCIYIYPNILSEYAITQDSKMWLCDNSFKPRKRYFCVTKMAISTSFNYNSSNSRHRQYVK